MPQHRRVLLVRPVAGFQPGRRTAASSARMLALRSSKLRGSEPEVPLVRGGGKPAGYQPQTSSARSRHPANPSGSPANHRRHSRRYLRWHRDWATIPVSRRPGRSPPPQPAQRATAGSGRRPLTAACPDLPSWAWAAGRPGRPRGHFRRLPLDSQSMAHSPSAPAINASARWKATAGHGATRGPVKSFSTYIKTAASPPAPPSGLASFVGQSSAGSPRFPAAMRSPASVRSRAEVQWEVRACAGCGRPR